MNHLNGLLSSSNTTESLPPDIRALPVGQLESLRFKTNQIVESIQLLQRTLNMGGAAIMPPWPEILSKYNILLSQSHSLSMSLAAAHQASTAAQGNPYERIALAPRGPLSDAQVDGEFIHHLRTQPTVDVLRAENDAVRHLAGHMDTKGSLGVLGHAAGAGPRGRLGGHPEYEDVLRECEEIRVEHDLRVERATRAVELLRERYDWKSRVEVDQEEPEDWEPGFGGDGAETGEDTPSGGQSNDSEEEEELEEVLGNGEHTPEGSAGPATPMA
ncbi:uncharacterized protein BXZ73DRAFT_46207 [Epithele typhae]|uniref:uncharacterized protein n=1 Tax=Epithele typhae TaxID=378194 RepID=UPI0020078CE6|nr:uncharacterized protein BXZ73DRAFT_46207 [Epithele typhae]KAH9933589.1 hypothetical protein BXZ73DRAFT_46207 [Epithele typhae]